MLYIRVSSVKGLLLFYSLKEGQHLHKLCLGEARSDEGLRPHLPPPPAPAARPAVRGAQANDQPQVLLQPLPPLLHHLRALRLVGIEITSW